MERAAVGPCRPNLQPNRTQRPPEPDRTSRCTRFTCHSMTCTRLDPRKHARSPGADMFAPRRRRGTPAAASGPPGSGPLRPMGPVRPAQDRDRKKPRTRRNKRDFNGTHRSETLSYSSSAPLLPSGLSESTDSSRVFNCIRSETERTS